MSNQFHLFPYSQDRQLTPSPQLRLDVQVPVNADQYSMTITASHPVTHRQNGCRNHIGLHQPLPVGKRYSYYFRDRAVQFTVPVCGGAISAA